MAAPLPGSTTRSSRSSPKATLAWRRRCCRSINRAGLQAAEFPHSPLAAPPSACARRLPCRGDAAGAAFGLRRLARGGRAAGGAAAACGTAGLARECTRRHGVFRLALQNAADGALDARLAPRPALSLPRLVGVFGALARALRDSAFPGRRQLHAGAPRLRKADGDRLFGRARAVLAATNPLDLLMHEFARLRRGRLALARRSSRAPDRFLPRHYSPRVLVPRSPNTAPPRIDPLTPA